MSLDYLTAIMIIASYCNLDCEYCYAFKGLRKSRGHHVMKREVIAMATEQLFELGKRRIDFNWHGGEPLLGGMDVLEYAILQQADGLRKYPATEVYNKIQTNGTLITPDWAAFLKHHAVNVGVSIDGPSVIQDRQRPFLGGGTSFANVMRGIELLESSEVIGGRLLVVTPHSLVHIKELYDFCKQCSPRFDVVPCFHVDKNTGQVLDPTISPQQYGDFLVQLFDLWIQDDNPTVYIRFFDEILRRMLGGSSTLCSTIRGCEGFVTIDWNGDVYPCDNFSGYQEFLLGNIKQQHLRDIMASSKYKAIIEDMTTVEGTCTQCRWRTYCNGGCAHQTFMPGGNFAQRNFYCESRRRVFAHVHHWLSDMDANRAMEHLTC